METITISKGEYEDLLEEIKFLNCLIAAGVDNWDGYDVAMQAYQGDE